uniref:Sucrase-like protein n=1 Tax=Tetraselmis sp. GSL018 TaxID=582737 RepID=A0A061RM99_9CHLO
MALRAAAGPASRGLSLILRDYFWQKLTARHPPSRGLTRDCACVYGQAAVPDIVPAEPGSVQEHNHHIFVRLPFPRDKGKTSAEEAPWWPAYIEREPGVVRAFSAVAQAKKEVPDVGNTKVSACLELGDDGFAMHDVLIFPRGVEYRGLSEASLETAVFYHLSAPVEQDLGPPPPALPSPVDLQESICLFVCCHAARDSRCGIHGVPLAAALFAEAKRLERGGALPEGSVRVFQCSHIGGHKYAGNVLVHGLLSPYDGDWYGGLRPSDARGFLQQITSIEDVAGGSQNPMLRKWWRGCLGLTRAEQLDLFQRGPEEEEEHEEEQIADGGEGAEEEGGAYDAGEFMDGLRRASVMDQSEIDRLTAQLEASPEVEEIHVSGLQKDKAAAGADQHAKRDRRSSGAASTSS